MDVSTSKKLNISAVICLQTYKVMLNHLDALKIALISFLLTSCALTGSLFYERIDEYLGNYLKQFADFSIQQESQIDAFTLGYKEFLAKNELVKIKATLTEIKGMDHTNIETLVATTESDFRIFLATTSRYFEQHFVSLAASLTEAQILQIKEHLSFKKDSDLNDLEHKEFYKRVLDRFRRGFKRIGIRLDKNQIEMIQTGSHRLYELSPEWRRFQSVWIDDLTELIIKKNEPNFEEALIFHLRRQNDIGDAKFRERVKENRLIVNGLVVKILYSLSPEQKKKFCQQLDFFISVIDRVISRYEDKV